jgi:hypothetical protein
MQWHRNCCRCWICRFRSILLYVNWQLFRAIGHKLEFLDCSDWCKWPHDHYTIHGGRWLSLYRMVNCYLSLVHLFSIGKLDGDRPFMSYSLHCLMIRIKKWFKLLSSVEIHFKLYLDKRDTFAAILTVTPRIVNHTTLICRWITTNWVGICTSKQ